MRKLLRLLTFALLLIVTAVFPARAGDDYFKRYVLENGLTILVNEMPSSPMAAVDVWVKTGSANEGKYIGSGITHFLEHMLFKGTPSRDYALIHQDVRSMGGSINASTSHDFTVFTLSVPKSSLRPGVDLLADMLRNPLFDIQQVERERDVIIKEMRMRNDNPGNKLYDVFTQTVYLTHTYRHPIIGYEQVFRSITRDQIVDYYKTYYAPNNMILSVAGGVKAEEVLEAARKAFGDFAPQSTPVRNIPSESDQITPRERVVEYPTDLFRMIVAYQGVPLMDKDLFALDVLAAALGDGESSRLYQELYEKDRLVESVSAYNDTPLDRGYFQVACLLKKDEVSKVVDVIQSQIDKVKSKGLELKELNKIKRQVMAQHIYGRQTAEGMAYRAAIDEAFTGDALFSEKYLAGVRGVTNEDIKHVAAKYLVLSARSLILMKPREQGAAHQSGSGLSPAADSRQDPEMVTLRNGLRLILKKDRSLPVVSIRLMFRGGLREEPAEKAGLAELTGRVWCRGVKGQASGQMLREIEQRAGALSTGVSLDAFSLAIDVLSDDLDWALDSLALLLKDPTFPEDEIRKQKEDMLTALKARKDSIAQTSFRAMYETLFAEHPLRLDPLGTPDSLARITRTDIEKYFHSFLSARNVIVEVIGDIDPEKVKAAVTKKIGGLHSKIVTTHTVEELPIAATEVIELSMEKEQSFVVYGFYGARIGTPQKYALEVAVNALSSPLGGRLYNRIREELGKAYALSGFSAPGQDMGVCAFYVLTTSESVTKVRALIEAELKLAAEKGFSDKELSDAKNYLKSDFARDHQSIGAQASREVAGEFYGLGYKAYELYDSRIDAVTAENAREAVASFLDVNKAVILVTNPQK